MTEHETKAQLTDAWSYLFLKFKNVSQTLAAFRRHPDWKAALQIVSARHRYLFIELEGGRWALPEINVEQLFDLADKEFVEDLIRRGY